LKRVAKRGFTEALALHAHSTQVAAEKEAAKEAGEAEEGPLEVQGFLFKRLLERKPELKQELLSFRDHLLATSSADGDDTLKVGALRTGHGCPTTHAA
jgi:hypothetical protein